MQLKIEPHVFSGLQRDLSKSKTPSNFLYDARNIRITAREDSTLMSITNEKGTTERALNISGRYLGHCLINKYLVVFSVDTGEDPGCFITRFDLSTSENDLDKTILYQDEGYINFKINHPIEAIASYENDAIQKVYWTDGLNQPRVINVAKSYMDPDTGIASVNYTYFDFVPTLTLNENITVTKLFGSGEFPAGVIQYAFTYYNKYGQESNIFEVTPLQYISHIDRGASPEEKVANSFKIVVNDVDKNFDYLRIYSILRTSIDATPLCKRIQDISLDGVGTSVSYIDTGTEGDDIDPAELLYKGGEEIKAKTIEQKDNTLFFGNIELKRPSLEDIKITVGNNTYPVPDYIKENSTKQSIERTRFYQVTSSRVSPYINTLNPAQVNVWEGASFFKGLEYYRLGIQCQYKDGRWSEPCWVGDVQQQYRPSINNSAGTLTVPEFQANLYNTHGLINTLYNKGYRKIRPVYALSSTQDRSIILQGAACPTVYRKIDSLGEDGNPGTLQAQSSWLFRTKNNATISYVGTSDAGQVTYNGKLVSQYENENNGTLISPYFNSTEVMGKFKDTESFYISDNTITIHSPELIFNESYNSLTYSNYFIKGVGKATLNTTYGHINIQTSSPTIGKGTTGPIQKTIKTDGYSALISGLFYHDDIVDDELHDNIITYDALNRNYKNADDTYNTFGYVWPVYMWHKNGSLNNDINRNGRSAELLKKQISNYRSSDKTTYISEIDHESKNIQLFNSNELAIVKVDSDIYQGNIDSLIFPEKSKVYIGAASETYQEAINASRNLINKLDKGLYEEKTVYGLWKLESTTEAPVSWVWTGKEVGDYAPELVSQSEGVRIKYKSTPHLVAKIDVPMFNNLGIGDLPIVEVTKAYDSNTFFGGTSEDALKNNLWIPCGPSVSIPFDGNSVDVYYKWGDTYFQRFECLKTYPFTPEDINQVTEIASFMCETRVNIDGRYDRNRGLINNTNITPLNHNLHNPVYNQLDNFFNYRILDKDFYTLNKFFNQIIWSKEKQAGADVDLWTNITLASTYDLDGSKGEIVSLNAWKDQLYCFQTKGISKVLFNSRVQIQTSDEVPIEISNNYKVEGCRYISDGVGCDNKWTIKETPSGIYFIDSVTNSLYHIGQDVNDITVTHNMSSWFNSKSIDRIVYDLVHHDLYLVNNDEALCYSEILGQFTSFYDYGGISLLETYKDKCFCIKSIVDNSYNIYEMFEGDYNTFFNTSNIKPWYISFISNGFENKAVSEDKIFTNIEYRMDIKNSNNEVITDKSFDYIRVENEYQDTGEVSLSIAKNKPSNIKKKFRVWRIDIPRAIRVENDKAFNYKRDRIRNPWCNITLGVNNPGTDKAELHDIGVYYYV